MSFVFEDIFYSILIKNFSYRGCLHRGEVVLEQPRGCRVSVGSTEAEGVPLQEGHRDLQLQLQQQDPRRQDEPSRKYFRFKSISI